MILCDIQRGIEISHKIDSQEMKSFLGAMHRAINQVCHEYQWADI